MALSFCRLLDILHSALPDLAGHERPASHKQAKGASSRAATRELADDLRLAQGAETLWTGASVQGRGQQSEVLDGATVLGFVATQAGRTRDEQDSLAVPGRGDDRAASLAGRLDLRPLLTNADRHGGRAVVVLLGKRLRDGQAAVRFREAVSGRVVLRDNFGACHSDAVNRTGWGSAR